VAIRDAGCFAFQVIVERRLAAIDGERRILVCKAAQRGIHRRFADLLIQASLLPAPWHADSSPAVHGDDKVHDLVNQP